MKNYRKEPSRIKLAPPEYTRGAEEPWTVNRSGQILDALLQRTDLGSVTVEITEHPYHRTPEGNSEHGR
jgi:hypothetical protein